jgi:hypothetical protein
VILTDKSKRMRLIDYVAHMGDIRNAYKVSVKNLKGDIRNAYKVSVKNLKARDVFQNVICVGG